MESRIIMYVFRNFWNATRIICKFGKTSDANILNFMRKSLAILFGEITLMNTSRGSLQINIQQSNIFELFLDLVSI